MNKTIVKGDRWPMIVGQFWTTDETHSAVKALADLKMYQLVLI
jgi:hypothetical protein